MQTHPLNWRKSVCQRQKTHPQQLKVGWLTTFRLVLDDGNGAGLFAFFPLGDLELDLVTFV